MLQDRIAQGLVAGLAAAAATAGALLMFGWLLGHTPQAFVAIGEHVIGPGARDLAAGIGVVGHATSLLLWGVVFGLVAPRGRGLGAVVLAAAAVTLVAAFFHGYVGLESLRLGAGLGGPRAPAGPVLALHILQALGMVAGLVVARGGRGEEGGGW